MLRLGHRTLRASNADRWHEHPAVSTDLLFREKCAELLKRGFGTWTALFTVFIFIGVWMLLQRSSFHWDIYPYILLNLVLSCVAAVQGIILQISANRSDRVSSEVALHTSKQADAIAGMQQDLLDLQNQQMAILNKLSLVGEALGVPDDRRTRPDGQSQVPDALPGTSGA